MATKDKSKVRTNWKTQPRSKGGKFLPKDAHPEDYVDYLPEDFDKYHAPAITPQKPSHARFWLIVAYVGYGLLCFFMGAVGAFIGAHI